MFTRFSSLRRRCVTPSNLVFRRSEVGAYTLRPNADPASSTPTGNIVSTKFPCSRVLASPSRRFPVRVVVDVDVVGVPGAAACLSFPRLLPNPCLSSVLFFFSVLPALSPVRRGCNVPELSVLVSMETMPARRASKTDRGRRKDG